MATEGQPNHQPVEGAKMAPKSPKEIWDQIEKNPLGDGNDISAVFGEILQLDRYSVPDPKDPSRRKKMPEAEEVAPSLKIIGANIAVQEELRLRLKTAQESNNQTAIRQNLRLAELLGMYEPAQPAREQTTPEQPAAETGQVADTFSTEIAELINRAASAKASGQEDDYKAVIDRLINSTNPEATFRLDEISAAIEAKISALKTTELTPSQEQPIAGKYVWRAKDVDLPVKVTGSLGRDSNGRTYVAVEGSGSGVPLDELIRQEEEHPEVPIQAVPEIPVFNQLWEMEFGGENHGKNAKLLGDSYDAEVYRIEADPSIVIKKYKPRTRNVFEAERDAFLTLQGSSHLVDLLGIGENTNSPYLVKRFCDGENLLTTFLDAEPFPLEPGREITPEQRKLAAWFVSSMEALAEFYNKGITVTDFKLDDWLWDSKANCTKLIDLGNAQTLERLRKVYPEPGAAEKVLKIEHLRDIDHLLKLFLRSTEIGARNSMNFDQFGIVDKWPNGQDYLSQEQGAALVREIQSLNGVNSLKNIILMNAGTTWNQESASTAAVYIPVLKAFFRDIGIDISQLPTTPETTSTQPGSRPEVIQTPAQQALEKADSITNDFGISDRDIWAIYQQGQQRQDQ